MNTIENIISDLTVLQNKIYEDLYKTKDKLANVLPSDEDIKNHPYVKSLLKKNLKQRKNIRQLEKQLLNVLLHGKEVFVINDDEPVPTPKKEENKVVRSTEIKKEKKEPKENITITLVEEEEVVVVEEVEEVEEEETVILNEKDPDEIVLFREMLSKINIYSDAELINICKKYNLRYGGLKAFKKQQVEEFLKAKIKDYDSINVQKIKIEEEDVKLYERYTKLLKEVTKYTKEQLDELHVEFKLHKTSKHRLPQKLSNVREFLEKKVAEYQMRKNDIEKMIEKEKKERLEVFVVKSDTTKEEMRELMKKFAFSMCSTLSLCREKINEYLKQNKVLVNGNKNLFKKCENCKEIKSMTEDNFLAEFKSEQIGVPPKKLGYSLMCKCCLSNAVSTRERSVMPISIQIGLSVDVKEGEKFCQMCNTSKPVEDYSGIKRKAAYCKNCMSEYRKNNRANEKVKK